MTNEQQSNPVSRRKTEVGVVTSAKGDKTISVLIKHLVKNERYGKFLRRHTKMAAHDPHNTAKVGDMVELTPCRRMSKTKSWRLLRVVRPAVTGEGSAE